MIPGVLPTGQVRFLKLFFGTTRSSKKKKKAEETFVPKPYYSNCEEEKTCKYQIPQ